MPARQTYVKTSAGWEQIATTIQAVPQGLVPIVPTSVAGTGVSYTRDGTITATASTTISVNGVFTSAYRQYRVVVRLTGTGNTAANIKLRAGGVDTVTSNYYWGGHIGYASGTNSGYNANGSSLGFIAALFNSNAQSTGILEFSSPAVAQNTQVTCDVIGNDAVATGNTFKMSIGGTHTTASAYDGFTISGTSGTFTGTIQVYGYSQGGLNQPQTIQPFSQAAGTISLNGNSTRTRSGTITFPVGRFTVNPLVTLGSGEGLLHASVTSITTTGATITLTHLDANNWSATYPAYWQATQMTSASAGG